MENSHLKIQLIFIYILFVIFKCIIQLLNNVFCAPQKKKKKNQNSGAYGRNHKRLSSTR